MEETRIMCVTKCPASYVLALPAAFVRELCDKARLDSAVLVTSVIEALIARWTVVREDNDLTVWFILFDARHLLVQPV